ncbi:MAG: hypothetical protein AB7T14_01690 [Candidatus Methylacidiphilaceae bacterium]
MRGGVSVEVRAEKRVEEIGVRQPKLDVHRFKPSPFPPAPAARGEGDGRRLEAPGLTLVASPLGILFLGTISWWNQAQRAPRPVALPPDPPSVPASTADDEPHSFARLRSDYVRWCRQTTSWARGEDRQVSQAVPLDPAVARKYLPPIEAARACLQRHLHRRVTIDSLEPIGYEVRGKGVAIDYRATVRSPFTLYVVPGWRARMPEEAPEPVKYVWPNLLFDSVLPPGCFHDLSDRSVVARANEPLVFRWRIEHAQIVDGMWKILLASPALLEWNCAFQAAEMLALREGAGMVLHLGGERCLQPFGQADAQTWNELVFFYDSIWRMDYGSPRGYAERAQALLRASEVRSFPAGSPILKLETARRYSGVSRTCQTDRFENK